MRDRVSLQWTAGALGLALGGGLFLYGGRGHAFAPAAAPSTPNLVRNPGFETLDATNGGPEHFDYDGSARWIVVGYRDEFASNGITLESYAEKGSAQGSVSQLVRDIDPKKGKWLRFTFRGLAEDGFLVTGDQLAMKDRRELTVNGNRGLAGAAVWRTYEFEELLPFPEVDSVRLSVRFKNGAGKSAGRASFFVDDFALTQHPRSSRGLSDPADAIKTVALREAPLENGMKSLGGRWYYLPDAGERLPLDGSGKLNGTLTITEANANRLFYRDDRLVNPFAGNMTSWLRAGHLDRQGKQVTEDRFLPDNVTLTFDGGEHVIVRARNIPNHPTAKFPDRYGTQGYNPSYIQEHDYTYYLPLRPVPNPGAPTVTPTVNQALPGGAIGVAVNGVVFYNPFDAGMQDASSIMDRCCGHPSPDNRYHYHKYPICVNTSFVDKGERHSPIIGFAFDGIPVYGPYEAAGVMAKDAKDNPLNAFNVHQDPVRGWHYHVTPGRFPYILGGYFGKVDERNFRRGPRVRR
jgi:hypothetical protein